MTFTDHLDRTIQIEAPPALVFQFFTDDARWASWWGAGSTIDARPGGRVLIRYPNGVEVSGEVVDVAPPSRIVFTYGYASGQPIPPGASRVTIGLAPERRGTRITLRHEFTDAAVRDHHVQGWRYQLAVFANVVADRIHAGAAGTVDAWFDAWAETDPAARRRALDAIAAPDVRYADRFSLVEGVADLDAHIAGAQRFMPGVRLRRAGDVRQCQGMVLVGWTSTHPHTGAPIQGESVFTVDGDGRIAAATGFWA